MTKTKNIFQGGEVVSSIKLIVKVPCVFHYAFFPFDTTVCSLLASNVDLPDSIVSVSLDQKASATEMYGRADILPSHFFKEIVFFNDTLGVGGQNFSYKAAALHLTRYRTYYVLQAYMPNALTVMVPWLSFFITPDAYPARVGLGISSLVAIVIQYGNLARSLPKVGYLKAIDVWMVSCLIFVFSAMIEYGYICYLKRNSDKKRGAAQCVEEKGRRIDLIAKTLYPSAFILFALVFMSVSARLGAKQDMMEGGRA